MVVAFGSSWVASECQGVYRFTRVVTGRSFVAMFDFDGI